MKRTTAILLTIGLLAVGEIWLLGWVGGQIGVGWLLAILVLEAALGGWLMRLEGAKALRSLADARTHPDAVGERVTDAALVLVGGVLLVLPGFLSDAIGLICLLPFTRGLARRGVMAVLSTVTRPYRDQADLLRAKVEPDTLVEGQTVEGDIVQGPGVRPPRPDEGIIRGEIEP